MGKIVAIVGRPNVGKSTLFNRLVGERKAIVDDFSGVTRDRHYGVAEWLDRKFTIVDTGGFVPHSDDLFEKAIRDQVKIAIEESDLLLFMVDVTTGITDLDSDFANILRKSKKPVFLVVNKVDNNERLIDSAEFYGLGFAETHTVSSASGSGTGDLLDLIVSTLKIEREEEPIETEEENAVIVKDPDDLLPKIAILGRPNVGKSSFINSLLGFDRNIVTPIAGTTRDTIHTKYSAYGKEFLLVDTAGIRKKAKVKEDIEFYSVMRSLRALESSDVCVIMIDATQGLESQDVNLFHLAHKNGKGIILLVNKWDLVEEKGTNTARDYEKAIKEKTAPFVDFPVIFISVLEKQRIFKAVEEILAVYENLSKHVQTHKLNEFILPVMEHTPPPATKGKYIKIKYVTQLKLKPPTFVFFCNLPQYIRESYKRFLENKIREEFNFSGTPIRLFFRKK